MGPIVVMGTVETMEGRQTLWPAAREPEWLSSFFSLLLFPPAELCISWMLSWFTNAPVSSICEQYYIYTELRPSSEASICPS